MAKNVPIESRFKTAMTMSVPVRVREQVEDLARKTNTTLSEIGRRAFVFTTEVGTPLGNNMGRAFSRVLRMADGGKGDLGTLGPEQKKPRAGPTPERTFTPKFRLYALRHTFATLALYDGVPLLEVSRILGHKDLAFTARVYGHVQAKQAPRAAQECERRWSGGLQLVA